MCAALARAHDLGVVHRDLKSDNILLTTRGGRKDFVKILDFGLARLATRSAPRAEGRGLRNARVHVARAGARRRGRPAERSLRARRPLLRDAHRAAARSARTIATRCSRCSAARRRRKPRVDQARRAPAAEAIVLQAPREGAPQALPGRPPPPRRAEGAAALAAVARRGRCRRRRRSAGAAPPPPPPQSPGVIEWASRAALFSRMVSARLPDRQRAARGADAASRRRGISRPRATRLEGEVASHTRKLEALERRGRALRAEIGRKVEELAHEESRALREAAAEQRGGGEARASSCRSPSEAAAGAKAQADQAAQQGGTDALRAIFERAGAAAAHGRGAPRGAADAREQKAAREGRTAPRICAGRSRSCARSSRATPRRSKRISPRGREKVAARTREGLAFEKAFSEVVAVLVAAPQGQARVPRLDGRAPGDERSRARIELAIALARASAGRCVSEARILVDEPTLGRGRSASLSLSAWRSCAGRLRVAGRRHAGRLRQRLSSLSVNLDMGTGRYLGRRSTTDRLRQSRGVVSPTDRRLRAWAMFRRRARTLGARARSERRLGDGSGSGGKGTGL